MKKILVCAALLAVLAAVYIISEQKSAQKQQRVEVALAEGFDAARAATVTIRVPGKDEVLLNRQGEAWTLTVKGRAYAAETSAVKSLLEQVAKMKSATAVSRNPKNFDQFEVSDAKAVEVKIEDPGRKVLAHVLLGKSGPDIFSTYVRGRDAQTVYLVPGILKNLADKELKDWRDKTIFRLNREKMTQYSVSGDMKLQLVKDGAGQWQAACGGEQFAVKKDDAEQVLQNFASLRAADFADGSLKDAQLDKPLRTITAVLGDGARAILLVGKDKNAFQKFVKTGSQEQMFVVEKSEIDSMAPPCDKLKNAGRGADNATDNASRL